jgi:hypothetical protein
MLSLRRTDGPDWCFRGGGIGRDTEAKRNVSNEFGKGFARWFCYEHLHFTYFCPLEDRLNKPDEKGWAWTRAKKGDLPDYVCGIAESETLHLLEAKGRYTRINFGTKAFQGFRDQVERAALIDHNGQPVAVKGLVSLGQWATEKSRALRARLSVEDPQTPGRDPRDDEPPPTVGRAMVAGHYVPILRALRLYRHAVALRDHERLDRPVGVALGVWECARGPLQGRCFVGGILPEPGVFGPWPWLDPFEMEFFVRGRLPSELASRFPVLLAAAPRFFGLEQFLFERIIDLARRGAPEPTAGARLLEQSRVPEATGSLSLLRDGTVLGPARYFQPVDIIDV